MTERPSPALLTTAPVGALLPAEVPEGRLFQRAALETLRQDWTP
jgi:hypothetical protein